MSTALSYSKWHSLLPLTTKATCLHHYQEAVLGRLWSSYWSKAKTNEKPRTLTVAIHILVRFFNSCKRIFPSSAVCLVHWQQGTSTRGCHLRCCDLWFLQSHLGFLFFYVSWCIFSNMECVWLTLIFFSHLEGTHFDLNSASCASKFFLRLLTQVHCLWMHWDFFLIHPVYSPGNSVAYISPLRFITAQVPPSVVLNRETNAPSQSDFVNVPGHLSSLSWAWPQHWSRSGF